MNPSPRCTSPRSTRPRRSRRAVATLLGSVLALASPTAVTADDVLEIERTAEMWSSGGTLVLSGTERGTIYLGDGRARYDQGSDASWIFLRDEKKLLLLDHRSAVYQEIPVPVRLEDHLDPKDRERLRAFARSVEPDVTVVRKSETRRIDGWSTNRFILRGSPPEGKALYTFDLWITRDLDADHELYGDLLRSFGALHLAYRTLAAEMARLPGFEILRRSEIVRPTGGKDVDVRRLVHASRREVSRDLYSPPPSYRQVPFDPAAWVQLE